MFLILGLSMVSLSLDCMEYFFSMAFPPSFVVSVTSLVPSAWVIIVFVVVTVLPLLNNLIFT